MVDFTKSISNEQMVNGLKKLIRLNQSVVAKCNLAKRHTTDPRAHKRLIEHSQLHERHVAMLADSIRFLGGAPGHQEPQAMKAWLSAASSNSNALISAVKVEEDKLYQAYLEELEALKASDEVVDVINRAILETRNLEPLRSRSTN